MSVERGKYTLIKMIWGPSAVPGTVVQPGLSFLKLISALFSFILSNAPFPTTRPSPPPHPPLTILSDQDKALYLVLWSAPKFN